MRDRAPRALALAIALSVVAVAPGEGGQEKPADPPKKVLVELYTSQGCSSCPPASDLLGRLPGLGFGPDRVVPINFHVDYFNEPWADPFSDASHSRRQRAYNAAMGRDDLAFTPMMMVDGRHPLPGSDRPKVLAALKRTRSESPGVVLGLVLDGEATEKTLSVKVAARDPAVAGRELLVGVALTEDPVTTVVARGENAGRTLTEHNVARRFDRRLVTLEKAAPRSLEFRIVLPTGSDPSRFRVAAFVQDVGNGEVHQAESTPWVRSKPPAPEVGPVRDLKLSTARRKPRRPAFDLVPGFSGFNFPTPTPDATPGGGEEWMLCPACSTPYIPPFTLTRAQAAAMPHLIGTC